MSQQPRLSKSLELTIYSPRDGKNISLPQVEAALKSTLHMSSALASSLTRSLKPLLRKDSTFDLTDMRKHNVLEHDASFTRLDIIQGDNYTFQPTLFKAFLDDAKGGPVTIKTLAKTYIRRNKESRAAGSPRLPINLWFVNVLQTVSLLNTAQTGGKLNRELLDTFYEEERFPDVILTNEKKRTLLGLLGHAVSLLFHIVF
jgi:Peroxidase, family 2